MNACKLCSTQNRDSARFCVHCGASLDLRICTSCGHPNRPTARFCGACGKAMVVVCSGCSHHNRPHARYCQHCGLLLTRQCPHCGAILASGVRICARCGQDPTSAQALPPAAGLVGQRYRIVQLIAKGGMGAVHLVTDIRHPQEQRALKELSMERVKPEELPELIDDFRREAQLLRTLSHPNLVKVYDNFSQAGKEFLVMEFVQGQTLESMAGGRRLDETEVLGYAFQLCDVLIYLHSRQPPIIYRDLKPSNIMVETSSGILKLIDFGIARFYKPGKHKDTRLLGTPGFAPPEQHGSEQTDARSDIFALGVTLHVLLTNLDVTSNPWNYPPVRTMNARVSKRLEQIIQRATELEIEKRHQSMIEMRAALSRCRNGVRIAASLPTSGWLAVEWT